MPTGKPSGASPIEEEPVRKQIKRRVRTRQACESCRRRRRKCDGRLPCSQCVGYSYRCEYIGGHQEEVLYDQSPDPSQDQGSTLALPSTALSNEPHHVAKRPDDPPDATMDEPGSKGANLQPSSHESPSTKFLPSVDTVKGRFSNAHSSILLPRRLGQSMDLANHIRFHSYGWNVNTRLEPTAFVAPAVCRYLTYQDLSFYSRVFFEVVDPVYHFIDQTELLQNCAQYWTSERETVEDLEALVAGVVALGSFFSESPCPVESQLVEHAKQVLDLGSAYAPGRVSLNQIGGWLLRSLYLRLTTRPHLSWYASCATMHMAEAMGLHIDLRNVEIISRGTTTPPNESISSRGQLFECCVFVNAMISAEYGRSRVILQDAMEPSSAPTSKMVRLSTALIRLESTITRDRRQEVLTALQALPDEPSLFVLLKADVTIHLFRKHLSQDQEKLSAGETEALLSILRTGLSETRALAPQRKPWWNVLSTPFQTLMVLLAMDTNESLAMIEEAISVLGVVYNTFPTHLAAEVLQIAQTLVQGLERRKLRQAKLLGKAYGDNTTNAETPTYSNPSTSAGQTTDQAEAVFENWLTGELSWNWLSDSTGLAPSGEATMNPFTFR